MKHRIALFLAGLCALLTWGACGAADSESGQESVGEAALEVGLGAACGFAPTKPHCDAWLTCTCIVNGWGVCLDTTNDPNNCGGCGIVCRGGQTCQSAVCACPSSMPTVCNGTCVNQLSDEGNCGSCGNTCGAGQACGGGVCGAPCTYQRDCPTAQVCIGAFLGADAIGYTGQGTGACQTKNCTTNAQCEALDATGVIAGWGATSPNDNIMKCFPLGGGVCYATASDPHKCGPAGTNMCGAPYNAATCLTKDMIPHGCDGAQPPCTNYHAKSTPGYWRDCIP